MAACQTTSPAKPQLPHETTIVPDQVKAPKVVPGMDARIAWKLEEAARIEANKRLCIARKNLRKLRLEYAK